MSRSISSLLAAVAALALASAAFANWSDDFDAYAVGSIDGQGGWQGWDGVAAAAGIVTAAISLSPPNSQEIAGPADSVHTFAGYTSGVWDFSAMMYIPSDFAGETYFLLLNVYNDGGPYDWSVQLRFNGADNKVYDDFAGGASLDMIRGQWVLIRNVIDLDNDLRTTYYGGSLLASNPWKTGGGSQLNIGCVDLFANGASAVYYDDLSLTPEPGTIAVVAFGLGALLLRRRK